MRLFGKKWNGFTCTCEHTSNEHTKIETGSFFGNCLKCDCAKFKYQSIYAKAGKCNNSGKKCYACPLMICYLVKNHKGEHSYTPA